MTHPRRRGHVMAYDSAHSRYFFRGTGFWRHLAVGRIVDPVFPPASLRAQRRAWSTTRFTIIRAAPGAYSTATTRGLPRSRERVPAEHRLPEQKGGELRRPRVLHLDLCAHFNVRGISRANARGAESRGPRHGAPRATARAATTSASAKLRSAPRHRRRTCATGSADGVCCDKPCTTSAWRAAPTEAIGNPSRAIDLRKADGAHDNCAPGRREHVCHDGTCDGRGACRNYEANTPCARDVHRPARDESGVRRRGLCSAARRRRVRLYGVHGGSGCAKTCRRRRLRGALALRRGDEILLADGGRAMRRQYIVAVDARRSTARPYRCDAAACTTRAQSDRLRRRHECGFDGHCTPSSPPNPQPIRLPNQPNHQAPWLVSVALLAPSSPKGEREGGNPSTVDRRRRTRSEDASREAR